MDEIIDREMFRKLLEIQYLKGRLDELWKGYVPYSMGHDNRVVDSRISKYENKLKQTDELSFHLYPAESETQQYYKQKRKTTLKELIYLE